MEARFEIHKFYDVHVEDEELAEAFAKAKESYGPRPDDMDIKDYINELMNEDALYDIRIYINSTDFSEDFHQVEMYYGGEVYDFVFNYIADELTEAQKRIEAKKIEYI